jgi:hypothetical protein
VDAGTVTIALLKPDMRSHAGAVGVDTDASTRQE